MPPPFIGTCEPPDMFVYGRWNRLSLYLIDAGQLAETLLPMSPAHALAEGGRVVGEGGALGAERSRRHIGGEHSQAGGRSEMSHAGGQEPLRGYLLPPPCTLVASIGKWLTTESFANFELSFALRESATSVSSGSGIGTIHHISWFAFAIGLSAPTHGTAILLGVAEVLAQVARRGESTVVRKCIDRVIPAEPLVNACSIDCDAYPLSR